ncbi:4-hydroxy-tetrahydrodipicolinate reductase [Dethiothermospora halolimnae]|uniref:4-hydroxy-tetrahydrodipicolinate reductase n=1 Tax=Dethiothermospora halolimnae TaxID=3114390 RepID=UPI003CCC1D2A
MIRTIIYGCNGKMGQVLSKQLMNNDDFQIICGIDRNTTEYNNNYPVYNSLYQYKEEVDVIIDFSHRSYLDEILEYSLDNKIPVVIATTGFDDKDLDKIKGASREVPILHSSNMSLGINVLSMVLKQISELLDENFDIEIIEKHHNRKIDAPSGTAYLLANTINDSLKNKKQYVYGREGGDAKRQESEIGIHALRGGTISGEHSVIFAGLDEVIELKHTALSKNIFAVGAMRAARFLVNKSPDLYTMNDIFNI